MLGCRVNQEDFITVNHEMGHIQYYLQYSDQSYFFRTGDYSHCHIAVKDGRMVFLSKVPTRASTRGWLTSFPLLLAPQSTSRYLIWVSLAPLSYCLKITKSFFPALLKMLPHSCTGLVNSLLKVHWNKTGWTQSFEASQQEQYLFPVRTSAKEIRISSATSSQTKTQFQLPTFISSSIRIGIGMFD